MSALVLSVTSMTNSLFFVWMKLRMFRSTVAPRLSIFEMKQCLFPASTNSLARPCHRHQGLSVDSWVTRLVESLDLHLEPRIL